MADSLSRQVTIDSSARMDSLKADSTARMANFKHQRSESPIYSLGSKKKSAFFVYPRTLPVKQITELDSLGENVIISQQYGNNEPQVIMVLPLGDYIDYKMEEIRRSEWEKKGYEYKLQEDKDDLGKLITSLTNIEIPLPSASFLSIFGPPRINLRINGAVDIHGAWRNETTEGVTASLLGNSRNEPDFKQQVQINVDGTIGDKLSIKADWNTERTFQYENQLKIEYTGYEDEIIQKIQAGNVSLQTSPLVGGSEALFGIKADFQFGAFKLTALASQKKGEIQEVSVSGGAKSQNFEIRAYEYSQNHYFLDTVYASQKFRIFEGYYGQAIPQINDQFFVKDIEVWKTISTQLDRNREKFGNAYINLPPRSPDTLYRSKKDITLDSEPGIREINRRFIKLTEGVDYILHPETGFITFKTQVQRDESIGVAYRVEGPSTSTAADDLFYGEFDADVENDQDSTIVLKLIKPPNLQPQFEQAWQLQLKNIYPIGGRDVQEEGFTLNIFYELSGQEPVDELNGDKLIEAFGLDFTDESKTGGPDGAFDFIPSRTIIPETGEIIFPSLEPFGRNFPGTLSDSLKYDAVYDTTVTFAKQDKTKDKFVFRGEYSASVSSVYNIGFNVVENSVRVTLNGAELTPGVDYSVDYNIGQVVIRKAEALVPGANLSISYEQNDLFQLASKTLLGLRGIYEFDKRTSLGFSFLNLNQQTLSDKVRINEEPLNNSIFGLDFKTGFDLPFLTKGLDYLFSTSTMSTFSLQGEFAYVDPDPNSKKSTIGSDGGKSIAYIDDFEGSKKMIPLGISYTGWRDLSVPENLPYSPGITKNIAINHKAKTFWFNILPSDVTVQDIWGDRKQVARENEQVTALDFVYRPNQKGLYNWNPSLDTLRQNWGGMMKILSTTANNLVEENIEFIEFWIKVEKAPSDAKIYIDLGQISEDVIPNNKLDSEDKNLNDLVDEGEDVGLDGLG
ncbi:MAG: cell surface protein SprA, partial [Melioribacteraceae bacterium]|nr:cell surface protein SprA [Melioribacteraceae bacterium]